MRCGAIFMESWRMQSLTAGLPGADCWAEVLRVRLRLGEAVSCDLLAAAYIGKVRCVASRGCRQSCVRGCKGA